MVARAVRMASGRSTIRGLFRLISSRWIARARKSATGTNQTSVPRRSPIRVWGGVREKKKTRHKSKDCLLCGWVAQEKSANLAARSGFLASYNNVREGGFGWRHWARRDVRARTPPRGAGCVDAPPDGLRGGGRVPPARGAGAPPHSSAQRVFRRPPLECHLLASARGHAGEALRSQDPGGHHLRAPRRVPEQGPRQGRTLGPRRGGQARRRRGRGGRHLSGFEDHAAKNELATAVPGPRPAGPAQGASGLRSVRGLRGPPRGVRQRVAGQLPAVAEAVAGGHHAGRAHHAPPSEQARPFRQRRPHRRRRAGERELQRRRRPRRQLQEAFFREFATVSDRHAGQDVPHTRVTRAVSRAVGRVRRAIRRATRASARAGAFAREIFNLGGGILLRPYPKP